MKHTPPQSPSQSPCILVVEDNQNHRRIMRLMLEHQFHYRIIEAANGQQAIEMATREKPILILMDLSLPLVSGMEATQAIHANPDTKGIPIVVVSSECWDGEIKEQMQAAGATECLDKILLFEQLHSLIALYLESSSSKT